MANKAKKIPHIKPINNFAMLFVLSIFQLITGFEAASAHDDFSTKAMLANLVLIALEWVYVSLLYVIVHRRNFELEFITPQRMEGYGIGEGKKLKVKLYQQIQ